MNPTALEAVLPSQTAVVASTGSAAVPANTGLPVITGTAQQGQNLYTTNGSWSGSPTSYAYQWLRCDTAGGDCVPIWGETFYGVTLSAADVNHTIRVTVTAANANGSTSATAAQTTVVSSTSGTAAAPANTGLPVITGTAQQGQNLSTSNGSWSGSPTSYTYQWSRC